MVVIAVMLVASVTAFTTQITAPATNFVTETSTTINVSCAMNVSKFPYLRTYGLNFTNHTINLTVYNKSSDSGAYGVLASSLGETYTTSNSSTPSDFYDFQATLANNNRHWIKCGFENVSRNADGSYGGSNTSVKIIQIDVDYDIFPFNVYNFSYITADGTKSYCGVSNANVWACVG